MAYVWKRFYLNFLLLPIYFFLKCWKAFKMSIFNCYTKGPIYFNRLYFFMKYVINVLAAGKKLIYDTCSKAIYNECFQLLHEGHRNFNSFTCLWRMSENLKTADKICNDTCYKDINPTWEKLLQRKKYEQNELGTGKNTH